MPPPKKQGRDKRTTLALVLACLVCGVPVAGTLLSLEITFFPIDTIPLKQPDAIINDSHIALLAAAFLALIASVCVALGTVSIRHLTPNNAFVGIMTLGFGAINFAGQLVILALVYISNAAHPESKSTIEVKFVNGQYDTGGRQFTHETFSCMMGNLYLAREPWSTNACSEYHYARYCTILLVNTGFLLLGISYWPVRKTLFAGQKRSAPAKV
ncbi:hypothetical protein K491DRAFT_680525 [Lophiostoma macrostomum CBS 122681]|uniref:MARVEL domain-containing protein n=1 Tax=Lophiostoma macrostomum CBS 122681 TaxID=1314788 RepID=A0A6A6T0F8_9PLEO|nr:hypothetical protein K491DRAFT_680525 [Lophiostoma macrostomum CBS 122681]